MPSSLLFHGPGAKEAALGEAKRVGVLVVPPIGSEGLKVDEARQVTELMCSVPAGDQQGVLVIGPMDEANAKSADTLLKIIEENPNPYMTAILWANDLGGVSMTIRSRCLERFVTALGEKDNDDLVAAAFRIIEATIAKDYLTVVDTARGFDKREMELIGAISEALSTGIERADYRDLWERLRPVGEVKNPFLSEIIVALVGA